jgi:hypothetical protein
MRPQSLGRTFLGAISLRQFGFDDGQTLYLGKMAFVEGGQGAAALQSGSRHDQIIRTNVFAGGR